MIGDVIDTFKNTAPNANQKFPRIEINIGQKLLAQQTNFKDICTPNNANKNNKQRVLAKLSNSQKRMPIMSFNVRLFCCLIERLF